MAYTVINFQSKEQLEEQVKDWLANPNQEEINSVYCYNPGLGPDLSNFTGKVYLEGPHFSKPHRWYAEAELVDGIVVKVS